MRPGYAGSFLSMRNFLNAIAPRPAERPKGASRRAQDRKQDEAAYLSRLGAGPVSRPSRRSNRVRRRIARSRVRTRRARRKGIRTKRLRFLNSASEKQERAGQIRRSGNDFRHGRRFQRCTLGKDCIYMFMICSLKAGRWIPARRFVEANARAVVMHDAATRRNSPKASDGRCRVESGPSVRHQIRAEVVVASG